MLKATGPSGTDMSFVRGWQIMWPLWDPQGEPSPIPFAAGRSEHVMDSILANKDLTHGVKRETPSPCILGGKTQHHKKGTLTGQGDCAD